MKRFLAALLSAALVAVLLSTVPCALAEELIRARTTLAGSSWAKIANIELAAGQINGITIPYGAEFSFNKVVGPRTKALGYQTAVNGRGVKVTGGGVAQVATTLDLALRQLEQDIEYTSKKTYGSKYSESYVSSGNDAILVDYSSGTDFSFINWGDDIIIEMWTAGDNLCCTIRTVQNHTGNSAGVWLPILPAPAGRQPSASASILISGSDELRSNILLAAGSINDTVLTGGDLFSFNSTVGPRSESYGYQSAVNGRGAKVVGGGVAQVASVIWLAVKQLDNIAIIEKSTYGSRYNQSYVSSSNDAILTDYSGGTDFSFRYIGNKALTISTYVSGNMLYCNIFED